MKATIADGISMLDGSFILGVLCTQFTGELLSFGEINKS